MNQDHDIPQSTVTARVMYDAIEAVTRFASRGCSGMSCDRVRVAWLSNQLGVIATHASLLPPHVRHKNPALPWKKLEAMRDNSSGTPGGLTADEMERFVERELPALARELRSILSHDGKA